MTVRIATTEVITVGPDADVRFAAEKMRAHHVGCVLVVDGARLLGILTDRDIALRVVAEALPPSTRVAEVMTPDPITAPASAGIETILRALRKAGTRRLPLLDDAGLVVGIVTHDDLVPLLANELRQLGEGIERAVDSSELR